jgi:hemolysin activation/secretion protein
VVAVSLVDDDENRFTLGKAFYRFAPGEIIYYKPTFTHCEFHGLNTNKFANKFNFDGIWQKRVKDKHSLSLKVTGQKTNFDYLPSSDQFYLGGLYSIRGFNENVIGGDSGMSVKLDYICPTSISKPTQFFTFYDWGRIYGKSLLSTRVIHAAGFGINHYFADSSSISLTVGYPFVKQIGNAKVSPHKVDLAISLAF